MLAIIIGSGFEYKVDGEEMNINTRYGTVSVIRVDKVIFLKRHTKLGVPPHKVNHKANIMALKKLNVNNVIGINSVGSLKLKIKPGTIVLPHDYLNLNRILTFFNTRAVHITPNLSEKLRNFIIKIAQTLKIELITQAVYVQTMGPRLETKAEINFFKDYADIVGMTMANEATLAKELNLGYASICSVDNYAHGIAKSLTMEEIKHNQKVNSKKISKLIEGIIDEYINKGCHFR